MPGRQPSLRSFAGNMYLPNAALTFRGNSTVNVGGVYAITMQSLRMLANAEARANMINCYTPAVVGNTSPSSCTGDYLSVAQKQAAAPLLYGAGLSPTVNTASGTGALTVTASQPSFTMLMPIWPTAFKAASASTSIPF